MHNNNDTHTLLSHEVQMAGGNNIKKDLFLPQDHQTIERDAWHIGILLPYYYYYLRYIKKLLFCNGELAAIRSDSDLSIRRNTLLHRHSI